MLFVAIRVPDNRQISPNALQCRVATQSQIHIGADSKNIIFALFWPENPSN